MKTNPCRFVSSTCVRCTKAVLLILCVIALLLFNPGRLKAAPPGSTWTQTFGDEFNNETGLDSIKWDPRMIWGSGANTGEAELYNNVLVNGTNKNIALNSGSSLKLIAIKDNPDGSHAYSSGLVASYNHFNQAFGYFECRAKTPPGKGLWPAIWMIEGQKEGAYSWPPEIDIMEQIGSSPTLDYMTAHYRPDGNYPLDYWTTSGAVGTVANGSQAYYLNFHTYAVDWDPDKLTYYIDDVPVGSTTSYTPYLREMHLILNLGVGGSTSWGGAPDANTVFPATYEVDWIRAYTKALPRPWAAADIGSPTAWGRTYASSTGLFNMCGSGVGLTGTSDKFQFAYLPLVGDGTIVARVKNEIGTVSHNWAQNPSAKAGVMIRETLSANARNVFIALEPVVGGTAGGNVFSSRSVTSGTTTTTVLGNHQAVPSWLKLVRSGTTLTGYSSTNGTTWVSSGTVNISMTGTNYVGLATSICLSGSNKATAQFDNILVTGTDSPVITSIALSPAYSMEEPGSTEQFSAAAYDQFYNALSPQPSFTWSSSGGGTIDSNGLFTSGSIVGGPYTATATRGAVSGTAPVTIVNIPNGPILLTATAATLLNGWVKLTWTDNSNIETGYRIQRLDGSGNFVNLASVGANVVTYTNSGLSMPSGPYTYRVYASGSSSDSDYSNVVTISVPAPPAGPTGLTATPGNNQVALSWNSVAGASNYNVQRATTSGTGAYTTIKTNNVGTTYTDATAVNGTTYYYKVCYNVSGVGSSLYCSPVSATPVGLLATITVSPTNATVQSGSNQQFSAIGKDSFGNNLVPQPTFAWSMAGGGTIDSSGLFSATTAGGPFTVTAASGTVNGGGSVTVTLPPPVLTTITVSPASAAVQTGSNQQFTAVGKDQYGADMSPQPVFAWTVAGGGSIDSSGLFNATTAGGPFTVTATSGTVNGTASVTVNNSIPVAPTGLLATWATMLNGWFKLTWTDNSFNETGFTIQSLSGTTWSTYATVGANVVTYTRTGLNMPSGPYNLRVIATGSAGNSGASNQVTFSIPAAPAGPTGLTATPGSNQVALSWTAVTGANNYNVQRAIAWGGPYSVIKYNNVGATYMDSTALNGTTYYYEVNYNFSGVGASLYCSPVSATLP